MYIAVRTGERCSDSLGCRTNLPEPRHPGGHLGSDTDLQQVTRSRLQHLPVLPQSRLVANYCTTSLENSVLFNFAVRTQETHYYYY